MKVNLFPHIFHAYLIAKRKWIVLLREQCENYTFLKDLNNGAAWPISHYTCPVCEPGDGHHSHSCNVIQG